MKKRVLSMLLAFILCFSTLPMTAFAQEADAVTEQEEQQETDSAEEQKEAEVAAAPGEETPSDKSTTVEAPDTEDSTAESVSDSDAGTQDAGADDEKKAAVQKVQALIDALPETVTEENAERVSEQLEAIDEAMESLTEEQRAELDMTLLHAISEAMNAPMTVAAGEHKHCICGKDHHEVGEHTEESMTIFTQKLWMDGDTLKIDDEAVQTSSNISNKAFSGIGYVLPTGSYYLGNNVQLKYPLYFGDSENRNVNLCLNGKTITANGDFDAIILYRGNGHPVVFSLTDCQNTGKITHSNGKSGCGVYVFSNSPATFNMYKGSIDSNAGHVTTSNSTTTINGGGVSMNNNSGYSDDGGIFKMYGGTITNNSATNGGGVYMCNNGGNIFNMYGGSITGNTATDQGGGVYSASGEITMTGGTIDHNKASQGGGVYVSKGGNFKISGSVQITGNTKESAVNNVELAAGKTITIQSGLAEDASIGVTTEKTPGTGDYSKVASGAEGYSLTEADAKRFFSDVDQSAYTIMCADNQLILTKAGDGQLHYHPICGETCTHTNADGTFQHKNVYWEATSTLTSDMPAGYYYLTKNVTLTQSWYPAAGMVLDLNGHDIIMNADGYVISRDTPGAFTLTDCMGGQGRYGKITHGNNYKGGGIQLASPAFRDYEMSFEMYGGSITGNTGSYPGVYLKYNSNRSITFNMYGGEITNNKNTSTTGSYKGGGVYVAAGNTFTMTGGKITGNQTATVGGGVYVDKQSDKQGNFIVSGDAQITENYKTDGTSKAADNVYLQSVTNGTQKQAYIQVNGALSNAASIGVNAGTIDEGSYKIVAQGSEYQLTDSDLQRFTSDASYTPKLVNNRIAFTNGTPHEHPICGDADCKDGHDDALWLPLTYENNQLKYGGTTASSTTAKGPGHVDANVWDTITEYTLPEGNYYLSGDITIDGTIKISGNVNLCLNGHTISTNSNKVSYAVIYTQYWKLSICDCTGKGSLKVPNNGVTNGIQTSADINDERGILYLYGGTISGGNCGVNVKGQLYLYGGTITKNGCGVSDAQKITIGGDVKITDNTCTNVELSSGKTITIDKSLTKDAKIGITTFPKPSKTTPSIQIAAGAGGSLKYTDIFKSDITDYVITQTGTDLCLGIHQHNWTYSAEEATITIKCDAENCNLGTDFAATYTVTAPTDYLTYSGSDKPATVEVSENATDLTLPEKPTVTYQKKNGNEFEALNGAPTDVGTYRASIRMGDKTASVTYDIVSKEVPNPTITVAGTYTYDGTKKKPSVVVKDGDKEIPSTEYSVSYADNINAGTATVTITDVDGGNYNVSGSTTFTIDKATITVTPTAGQTTIYGMSDPTLEYSSSGAMAGETPDFTGALSRKAGKDAGSYEITRGTLKLADNGSFKAANYDMKLADTPVQFTIVPKTLSAKDLEFITDSPITKTYDGTTACDTATVRIKDSAKAYPNDEVPTVTGTYAYNSAKVTEANKVTFTSDMTSNTNYILPKDLKLEHEASITKANQAALTITSTSATYGTDLTLTVDGGSGTGEVTYTVENGTGAATMIDGILHPVTVGKVTVQATKSGDDNYYDVQSARTTITIAKGTYPGTVSKTVNLMRNRSDVQEGILYAEDFFPKGQVPEYAQIKIPRIDSGEIVTVKQLINSSEGYILGYTSVANITSTTNQTCTVTITSGNYNDITATLIFHPTDKTTVTIEGLTYTDKIYDGSVIQPTGTLLVTGGDVPANKLEVLYEGTSANGTNYSSNSAPKDAGIYKVTYKVADSNENYTGEVTYTFTISPKNVTAGMIGTIAAQEYTGSAITPEPVVKDGGVALSLGTDFDLKYDNNINAGENTATVTINGKGNYTGTASRTFTINPKDIKGAVITLQADSLGYTGLMQEVQITSVILGQVELTANDYTIVNNSNEQINADDSITLTIAGKGNYTGTATTTWKITRATPALDNFDVTPDLSQKQTYDGKPKEVTAKTKNGVIGMGAVTVCYEGSNGTTYARSETAPTNAGSYKVILSVAKGKNYTAVEIAAGTLTIEKADLTVEDVTEFFEYTKKGEQTINLANLVPGARSYALDAYANDNGIVSGDITIDATGLMKFALSELTKDNIDKKVTVPVTITSENYKDVRVNVIIYISPEYRIIDGANSSWTQNTDGTVVIRGDGEFSRFHAVKVDGKVIDPANYAAKEGSTIITLKAEYLKTLATGSHTFAIVWNNGIAGTNFTVAANTSGNNSGNNSNNNDSNHGSDNSGNNDSGNTAGAAANTAAASAQELDKVPATGDASGIWLTLFVISLTGLAGMLARRKKN